MARAALAVLLLLAVAFSPLCSSFEADDLPGWLGETHRGQIKHAAALKEPHVTILSTRPRAFLYKNFLSEEECDHIVKISKPKLERSEVVAENGTVEVDDIRTSWGAFLDIGQAEPHLERSEVISVDTFKAETDDVRTSWGTFLDAAQSSPRMERSTVVDPESGKSVVDDYRSSSGTFLNKAQDEVVARIEERIARWTFLPIENQESMQVLRYGIGQKYEAHQDYFDESDKANQQGGHRIATVLMYLSNVEFGGETVFPDSETDRTVKDETWSECGKRGIAVKPIKGNALLFYSLHPNATTDILSTHAGCPVIRGEKWSATKWIHVRSFENYEDPDKDNPCVDEESTCASWAEAGECEKNPGYMLSSCRRSCHKC